METKYRIDFYYWKSSSGFSHIETVEYTNILFKANEDARVLDPGRQCLLTAIKYTL